MTTEDKKIRLMINCDELVLINWALLKLKEHRNEKISKMQKRTNPLDPLSFLAEVDIDSCKEDIQDSDKVIKRLEKLYDKHYKTDAEIEWDVTTKECLKERELLSDDGE